MSPARAYHCYTDGSCKPGDRAPGGWGFFVKTPDGAAIEGHGSAVGTLAKTMEYRAVAEALDALAGNAEARGASVTVFSDNAPLVENLTRRLDAWRASGFVNVDTAIAESVRRIAHAISSSGLVVRFQWVRAHNGNAGNERADALAELGAREAKGAKK